MTKQDPASTYTTAKFMGGLSGIPMNYEVSYATKFDVLFHQTQNRKKEKFSSGYIKVVTESGRYSRILFREQPLRPEKELWLKSS
jgi:hypothetical protein